MRTQDQRASLPDWARDDYGAAAEREDEAHSDASYESDESFSAKPRCTDGLGLSIFQAIEVATIASAAALASANVCLLAVSTRSMRGCILRAYVIGLSLVIGSSETNVSFVLEELSVLENWFCRGLFYSLVPMLTISVDEEDIRVRGGRFAMVDTAEFYSAVLLFACGVIYSGMGLTCRKQVKELMYMERKLLADAASAEPAPK